MPSTSSFDDSQEIKPLPKVLADQFPGKWKVQGKGLFTWSVFRVYRMALHACGVFNPEKPYALDLNYLRNVSAEQIAQASVQEMQRISGVSEAQAQSWGEQLLAILPDVRLGDRLIGVFSPGTGVWFCNADRALGVIQEPEFAAAFSAIWLDPQTRAPKLREHLLGLAG